MLESCSGSQTSTPVPWKSSKCRDWLAFKIFSYWTIIAQQSLPETLMLVYSPLYSYLQTGRRLLELTLGFQMYDSRDSNFLKSEHFHFFDHWVGASVGL